ncbi:CFA/I fimbrial subunit B [Pandoraea aquatica]|uniref:CFA/I fimbrial subunit B n=1 Tax=Pandoraea aquatica TaxID=2508290 RepID=A0A5E4VJ97_9BURK|nr:CS1 type fimbrial major subunit [Pandoraea aquatica]VVE11479.1 CFA/I fimbrial subunit B [Pandoraea aquatica]
MNMLKHFVALSAVIVPMAAANAAEVVIDLTATIDPTLSVQQANGSPMPQSLDMAYNAATGDVMSETIQTRLYTNDPTQNVDVRLGAASTLVHVTNASVAPIPLTVRLDGRTITTTNTRLTAAETWTGSATGESRTLPLSVAGRAAGANPPTAGRYVGRLEMLIVASAAE